MKHLWTELEILHNMPWIDLHSRMKQHSKHQETIVSVLLEMSRSDLIMGSEISLLNDLIIIAVK
jgi:hypothetical protein